MIETTTHFVCSSCGLEGNQKFVSGPYTSIETSTSFGNQFVDIGNKPSLSNGGKGSFIDFYGSWKLSDYTGNSINQGKFYRYARLKKINDYYSQSSGQIKLYRALQLLNKIHGVLDLPESIKDETSILYRNCYLKLPTQFKIPVSISACIYLASRMLNYNLLLKDLIDSCDKLGLNIKGKHLITAASEIKNTLKLQIRATRPEEYLEKTIISLVNNQELIQKLKTNFIGINEYTIELRQFSIKILSMLGHSLRGGRNPYILAAATVAGSDMIISKKLGKKRGIATQKVVAESCNIPEYTLREHYIKIIKPIINKL